ncbi:NADP-dependent 3-hydroxy acid dehydrogenase YdfG [Sinomicrobium oceani]|uniref:NADP-dependent 3-hydroxy acid dehydrogenase YdfG n=1 Tax=Sinomicrobium oceani TaxID=1150368 RepID=A0A1K1Q4T8_9FLAO|nr:SDR family oxidoreductase [Sinomicrobium oceani]SFW54733.1 NADP-dependent 3-hydroxy acid dehydrogenase YdfG [Sinomicrobium oceani]
MKSIEGKVVAITGASSGIGEATARHLASLGARVVLGARRVDKLSAVTESITAEGGKAVYRKLDVTDIENVRAFIQFATEQFGAPDVLVNNAGVMPLSMINSYKIEEWHRMIDVNIKGVLHGIAAALPVFESRNSGQFINITSVADRWVGPTSTVYSGTKFAVRAISEGLRQEVSTTIRVTLVAPGATESELAESISDPELKKLAIERFRTDLLPAAAIAKAVAYAMAQPADVDVNEIVVRHTAQKSF